MPWVVRDAVDDINRAVGRRWQGLDRLLPGQVDLPEGCAAPLVASGVNGRPAGLAVCRHQFVPADTLNQTWGTANRFSLTLRPRGPDTSAALDELLGQWRDHLAGLPEAAAGGHRGDGHLAGSRRQRGERAAAARDAGADRDRGPARRDHSFRGSPSVPLTAR